MWVKQDNMLNKAFISAREAIHLTALTDGHPVSTASTATCSACWEKESQQTSDIHYADGTSWSAPTQTHTCMHAHIHTQTDTHIHIDLDIHTYAPSHPTYNMLGVRGGGVFGTCLCNKPPLKTNTVITVTACDRADIEHRYRVSSMVLKITIQGPFGNCTLLQVDH